jgi:hypothetical protein
LEREKQKALKDDEMETPIEMAHAPRPKILFVMGVLAAVALTFSFLGSYAVYNALVSAGVVQQFTGKDPRPKWLVIGFCVLMVLFVGIAEFFRFLSRRQFKAIDAMADAKDNVREGWYET